MNGAHDPRNLIEEKFSINEAPGSDPRVDSREPLLFKGKKKETKRNEKEAEEGEKTNK